MLILLLMPRLFHIHLSLLTNFDLQSRFEIIVLVASNCKMICLNLGLHSLSSVIVNCCKFSDYNEFYSSAL